MERADVRTSISEKIKKNFAEIEAELKGSIVFTDGYAEEVLQWSQITPSFLQIIHSLHSLHSTGERLKNLEKVAISKGVFLLGGSVEESEDTIKNVLSLLPFQEALFYTPFSNNNNENNTNLSLHIRTNQYYSLLF